MRTALISFFTGSASVMGSFFTEAWFPIGDWRWAVGATVSLAVAGAIYAHGRLKETRKKEVGIVSDFGKNTSPESEKLHLILAFQKWENDRQFWRLLGYLPYLSGPLLLFAYLFARLWSE